MTNPDPRAVLALPMRENDADAATIRDYLIRLLDVLWDEKDCFSGKRPFGNSDWDGDLIVALVEAGFVEGRVDEDGYLDGCDCDAADTLIAEAIRALGTSVRSCASDAAVEIETRYVTADGRETEFDLHNGPCDCRREQRNVYAGPWLQAGGWVGGDSGDQSDRWRQTWTQQNPIHVLWSDLRTSRIDDPEARAGYRQAEDARHGEQNTQNRTGDDNA